MLKGKKNPPFLPGFSWYETEIHLQIFNYNEANIQVYEK